MSARRLAPVLAFAAALAGWPVWHCSSASAAFRPFALASSSSKLQAEYASEPAVSADGRYVVFTGIIGSKHGVYRKDLVTGELTTVAIGEETGAPSVSADGQRVAFTTADDPSTGRAAVSRGCTQVYVRNMSSKGLEGEEVEFQLASARDESEEPLTYVGSGKEGCEGGGSASANGVALSKDGSRVAFTIIGRSDLIGSPVPPGDEPAAFKTEPNQVAVRDLTNHRTALVSTIHGSPEPVLGGAALSAMPTTQTLFAGLAHEPFTVAQEAGSTAAISADGNAVAWMGINVREQAETSLSPPQFADEYAEPLWRAVGAGPVAPAGETRRVLAGDDPSERECPPDCSGGVDLHWNEHIFELYAGVGPQFGSYISHGESAFTPSSLGNVTPQMSADGSKVAILSTQPDYGHNPNFGNLSPNLVPTANAFVVDMAPGLTREQAITRLTEWASPNFTLGALDGDIGRIAISADGSRVLFATSRTAFPLAPPALITAPVSQLQPATQLYEANLQAGTLALVSQGYDGEPANFEEGHGGIAGAALSADGRVIALASGSSNLAHGSVNDGSGVFFTEENDTPEQPGIQGVTSLPPGPGGEPGWTISATARRGPRGTLLIDVSVPGPGSLAASASALVPTVVTAKGRPRGRTRGRSIQARNLVASRQVARAGVQASAAGLFELRLAPSSPYRALASTKTGLYATVVVRFSARGQKTLSQTLQASFPSALPPNSKRRAAKPRSKRGAAIRGRPHR